MRNLSVLNDDIFIPPTFNIVCFASGRGSNVRALVRALTEHAIPARVALILSNNSGAEVLAFARDEQIPWLHISEKQFPNYDMFVRALADALAHADAQLIVLAGYMKKLPSAICAQFARADPEVHPASLPAFGGQECMACGCMKRVLASGARESGATVHLVDEEYDHGTIVMQESVPVLPDDTPATLAARVLEWSTVFCRRRSRAWRRNFNKNLFQNSFMDQNTSRAYQRIRQNGHRGIRRTGRRSKSFLPAERRKPLRNTASGRSLFPMSRVFRKFWTAG